MYVHEAFETNWIAPVGPHLDRFEKALSEYLGVGAVAALSSGTAAIHLALDILGIGHGDEVICSSFTFAGSCNPILYQKASPVFVDSEPTTWNMDPALLEEAIKDGIKRNKKPKAIILVHLYGMPALMDSIMALAAEYDIPLIEDAAEALGSKYDGKLLGGYGDFGILSFNGNKIITTSGGGALTAKDPKAVDRARFLSTQARDQALHYEHSVMGYNYRLSNVSAAIGLGQMETLEEKVGKKRAVFTQYIQALGGLKGVTFLPEPDKCFSNRWLTTVILDPEKTGGVTREDIIQILENENIESRPLWKPMHLQPLYAGARMHGGQVSEYCFKNGLCLPSGTAMAPSTLERIITLIRGRLLL